jgi:lysozyme
MTLPRGLLSDLKSDEGWRPFAYQDTLGYWTIGYGFKVDNRGNDGLPMEIGSIWLAQAAEQHWNDLVKALPWVIYQPEDVQRALANMVYQLGLSGVLGFSLMLKSLERGDREAAAVNALSSLWAKQTPERAKRVADLIRGHAADGDD